MVSDRVLLKVVAPLVAVGSGVAMIGIPAMLMYVSEPAYSSRPATAISRRLEDVNRDGYLDVIDRTVDGTEFVHTYDPKTNTFQRPYAKD